MASTSPLTALRRPGFSRSVAAPSGPRVDSITNVAMAATLLGRTRSPGRAGVGGAEVEVAERRQAHLRVVQRVDLEAGAGDEAVDGPVEAAPAEHAALDGVEPVLPALHLGRRVQAVLHEVQPPTGPQHPADLAEGAIEIGDGAQG